MGADVLYRLESVSRTYLVRKGFFARGRSEIRAVDSVSLDLKQGEILGLVGESGCGKSTLARLILGLEPPSSGTIQFEGRDISSFGKDEMKRFRRRVQMVFQDPFSSLNPKKTVFQAISEPLRIHGLGPRSELRSEVERLLRAAGLDSPDAPDRYPHEFSGGQRQRIGIARALATRPDVLMADEPTSALDVSVQAQIINLILDLHELHGISCLFISHDLPLVGFVSHRIAVMYSAKLVETADRDELYEHPLHPYTQALLSAAPIPDPVVEEKRQRIILEGDVPTPINPPKGCNFNTRCPRVMEVCREVEPEMKEVSPGHWVACHLFD